MEATLILNIKGVDYHIQFPRIGKFKNIESLKQAISNGMYFSLMKTNTEEAYEALDMIDMEAYFSVLCPKLIEALECDSFSDLGMADYLEIKKIYIEKFVPWWKQILKDLNPAKTD